MFNKFNPKKRLFSLAVLISIVVVLAAFYYMFFTRSNDKVPTRGFFVDNYKITIIYFVGAIPCGCPVCKG